jgi:hypothetical protein
MIESDPIFGKVIKNYPSDRVRLALIGGGIYGFVAVVVNFAFLPVDAQTASLAVIIVLAVTALLVGWWVLHLWNREIVLYQRGFSYTEGSRTIFIHFDEITTIRQRAERRVYFSGLVRRTFREVIIKTVHNETIHLNSFYRRLDDFITRLEHITAPLLQARVEHQLAENREIPFSQDLTLKPDGIQAGERFLAWADYNGFQIKEGKLIIEGQDTQLSAPLSTLNNLKVLLDLLNAKRL